jgi:riboflavin synthase
MFTGIIAKTGKIEKIKKKSGKVYIAIAVAGFLENTKIGDSISCDGVCLPVFKKTENGFEVELMPETLHLTKFADSAVGDLVNLELSMKIGDRLDGHFVAGHIDGVGEIKEILKDGEYASLVIKVPKTLIRYLAHKGSAAVNGVSLTVAGVGEDWFKVCLITHTLEITNLSELKIGGKVNIETDIIARYLEKLLKN